MPRPIQTLQKRGTYQPFDFAILSVAVVAFGAAGLLTRSLLVLLLVSLPATLLGIWLGRRLYGRVDDAQFGKIVLTLLSVSGLVLVWSNL